MYGCDIMKKGFTLIEIIIVLAIIAILIAITNLNFIRLGQNSKIESSANDIAAMIKDVYENSNDEMDYTKWNVGINNQDDKFIVSLNNNGQTVRKIELKNTNIEINDGNSNIPLGATYYIRFNSNGSIIIETNAATNEYENLNVKISDKGNSSICKTIEIKSIPPGNVIIK